MFVIVSVDYIPIYFFNDSCCEKNLISDIMVSITNSTNVLSSRNKIDLCIFDPIGFALIWVELMTLCVLLLVEYISTSKAFSNLA